MAGVQSTKLVALKYILSVSSYNFLYRRIFSIRPNATLADLARFTRKEIKEDSGRHSIVDELEFLLQRNGLKFTNIQKP